MQSVATQTEPLTKKQRDARYRAENRDTLLEKKKKYRDENKEKIKETDKLYYAKNTEKIKERCLVYNEKNRENIQTKARECVECECGCVVNRGSLTKHRKTIKHKEYLDKI